METIQLYTLSGKCGMKMRRTLYDQISNYIILRLKEAGEVTLADLINDLDTLAGNINGAIPREVLPMFLLHVKMDLHFKKILSISLFGRTQVIKMNRVRRSYS